MTTIDEDNEETSFRPGVPHKVDPKSPDPHGIIGYDVPAADGSNGGVRVCAYSPRLEDYFVLPIVWSTGKVLITSVAPGEAVRTDYFKISYRYRLDQKRPW